MAPPFSSVVRSVRLGLMSVEIGFRTLLTMNCRVVPAFLPFGPISLEKVRV